MQENKYINIYQYYYSSTRPQTVEKISSVAIAVAEVMFDMAFWARRSRCKMTSQMQHYGGAEFSGTDGPCAYGAILGSFLVVLGVVWCHFWSSWGLFGVPGGGLERSRAVLGRPLVAATPRVRYLGRFLNRPGGPRWIFGSPWGPKRAPKRSPKTTKKRS